MKRSNKKYHAHHAAWSKKSIMPKHKVKEPGERHNFKKILIQLGIALFFLSLLSLTILYMTEFRKETTYVIYIGRYKRENFDLLHEKALHIYIDKLNAESKNQRVELKIYSNNGDPQESRKIYEQISKESGVVAVIDNTWGSELRAAADIISQNAIPVIAINADKQGTDYSKNVVFTGYEDNLPVAIASFVKKILKNEEIIFVTESGYVLKNEFLEEFNGAVIKTIPLDLSSNNIGEQEISELCSNLNNKIAELRQRQPKPTIILNVHGDNGSRIISYLDNNQKDITMLGGPYIINWKKNDQFGRNKNNNKLIMFTYPKDAITNKVYNDLKNIGSSDPKLAEMPGAQLYVKRCLDAVSIIAGGFKNKSDQESIVSKDDLINFFKEKLAGQEYVDEYSNIYSFDNDLRLADERTFETYFRGEESFSYPMQLNSRKEAVCNVHFGLEDINISNIDIENKSFHANFYYWLKYDKDYPDVEKYIHFRNEISPNKPEEFFTDNNDNGNIYKRYKMSADFSIDVDFRKYPLDTQALKIELALIRPNDDLRLSFEPRTLAAAKNNDYQSSFNEWYAEPSYVTVDNLVINSFTGNLGPDVQKVQKFKILTIRMPIYRRLASPLVTIFLPLIMLGFVAISLLYVKDSSFSNIGGVCVGIFLSMVTYSLTFARFAPKSSVMTIADILFCGTFAIILLVFLRVITYNSAPASKGVRDFIVKRTTLIGNIILGIYCLLITFLIFEMM